MIESLRRPWQERAWGYRRQIGELRYALSYMGNAARRMLLYPAAYVPGQLLPVPVEDSDLKQYATICNDALVALSDVAGCGTILRDQIEHFGTVGECYLVNWTDRGGDGPPRTVWEIRSLSELRAVEGRVMLFDLPSDTGWYSPTDGYELHGDDFVSRLWWPDPQWRKLADSPIHSAEDICEELIILSKDVRAAGVSRLANNGLLLLPDTLSVNRAEGDDDGEGEDDPFLAELVEAATEAVRNPGSAAAAVPIVARGPAGALEQVRHLVFSRPEADNSSKRSEALRRLATSLDLPAEVLTGMADLNHWSAWFVDDSTFRHHLEPYIQVGVDALTAGYFRLYLAAAGVPPEAVLRLAVWYNPTELLTKPDKTQDAKDAFEADALSWEALRRYLGFTEEDAPDAKEQVLHLLLKSRALDPGLASQLVKLMDPRLEIPAAPAAPPGPPGGEPPAGPEPGAENPDQGPPPQTGPPDQQAPTGPGEAATDLRRRVGLVREERRQAGSPAELQRRVAALRGRRQDEVTTAIAAAGAPVPDWAEQLSTRLCHRDGQVRESVRAACEAAVRRTLEKAGAKVVTRARQRDQTIAAACRDVPAWLVPATLGRTLIAALGLSEDQLVSSELTELKRTWDLTVTAGMEQALGDAARLIGASAEKTISSLAARLKRDRDSGWDFLRSVLERRTRLALSTNPTLTGATSVDTAQLVPTSGVRAALAVAGGFNTPTSRGINETTMLPNDPAEHFGQLGTGTTVKQTLEAGGAKVERYRWVYGFSIHPFPAHQKLDGFEFDAWDDKKLETHPPVRPATLTIDDLRHTAGWAAVAADPEAFHASNVDRTSDKILEQLAGARGFDRPPKTLSETALQGRIDAGGIDAWRGMQDGTARFRKGPYYGGVGHDGNGIYLMARPGGFDYAEAARRDYLGEHYTQADVDGMDDRERRRLARTEEKIRAAHRETAAGYGQDLLHMTLAPDAQVVERDELTRRQQAYLQSLQAELGIVAGSDRRALNLWIQTMRDPGRFATAAGIDAYWGSVPGELVVLNRSKLVISDGS